MTTQLTITLDNANVARQLLASTPVKARRAARRAINNTLISSRTAISKRIRQENKVPAREVRARLKVIRATDATLTGIIRPERKGLPLLLFQARQTRRGVTYTIRGRRKLLKSAFIRNTSRGRQVLKRASDPNSRSGLVPRLPIYIKYGPNVPSLFEAIIDDVQRDAFDVFQKNFRREFDYELNRR